MKKFKYSFTYTGAGFGVYGHTQRRYRHSGVIEATDENAAKKKLRLWENFKDIKGLTFTEVKKFGDFKSLDDEAPTIGKPLRLVRYNEDKEIVGWLDDFDNVYIPSKAVKEPSINFKLFKEIAV